MGRKSSKDDVDERKEGTIGQGELYSPDHAIKIIDTKDHHNYSQNEEHNNNYLQNDGNTMVRRGGVAMDVRNRMGMIKDRLMEKLMAASVPSDAVENAKQFVEMVIRDVSSAGQGITKEALQRIKAHLVDILPSISPSLTSKMVDDAEKEAASGGGGGGGRRGDKGREMEITSDPQHQTNQQQQQKVAKMSKL